MINKLKYSLIALTLITAPAVAKSAPDMEIAIQIHNDVNSKIKYRLDSKRDPSYDSWEIPTKYGDCEDFALLKMRLLLEAGFAEDDVSIIVVIREVDTENVKEHNGAKVYTAHAVLKIDSLNVIMDSPTNQTNSGYGGYSKTYVMDYEEWMKKTGSEFYCKIGNIDLTDKLTIQQRCIK